MEDILDSGDSDETLDGISVERDSRSRLLNAYGLPINARGKNEIQPTKSTFHCAKEFRCAINIGFEDFFQSDLFRSVDTF